MRISNFLIGYVRENKNVRETVLASCHMGSIYVYRVVCAKKKGSKCRETVPLSHILKFTTYGNLVNSFKYCT